MHKNTTTLDDMNAKQPSSQTSNRSSEISNRYAPFGSQYLFISSWKVFFMAFLPGYMYLWFWRNWRIYKAGQAKPKRHTYIDSGEGVFWRTAFFLFMLYPLYKSIFSKDKLARTRSAFFMVLTWVLFLIKWIIFLALVSPTSKHALAFLIFFMIFKCLLISVYARVQCRINKHVKMPIKKENCYKFQRMRFTNYFWVVYIFVAFLIHLLMLAAPQHGLVRTEHTGSAAYQLGCQLGHSLVSIIFGSFLFR